MPAQQATPVQQRRLAKVHTLFLSDIHLGYRRARVRELADFLQGIEARQIVLVGDIIDALSLGQSFFWSAGHTNIVRLLLARRRAGTRLLFIPGNHDASLAMFAEVLNGQLEVHREWVHRTARGQRLLVTHGDRFDGIVPCAPWLTRLGDALYYVTVALSHGVNNLRRVLGKPYWPLAERIKLGIGPSLRYIERYERVAVAHASAEGYDGIICGHIHRANLREIDGTVYCNTGDWVESCSALIETLEGELQLLRWPDGLSPARRPTTQLVADAA
ncbi:MAG TPA: UDP-2,3-diacylglucosamine diphosphatase [Steroidobacteraceae bacterium]|nr:UDP-2,3-diacylglucosamine diphosphatase [Steroidobacteraceae bacterium]